MKSSNMPTMKDVARHAGVSLGTVSKVINHIPVGEMYKQKVENSIKELGYEVNTYARGLKTRETKLITLIVPDTCNPFFAAFTQHVEANLYERGYKLILCCSNGIPEKEIGYLSLASQNKTDGIIALTYTDISRAVPKEISMVSFDRYFENLNIPMVASDNFQGGYLAVKKLIEFGCHRPGFIRFHSSFPGEADKRLDGYLKACKDFNLKPAVMDHYHGTVDQCAAITEFINKHKTPDGALSIDGIFANTDSLGYLSMKILKEMGYQVPEDVQIIGFDGIRKYGIDESELFISSICQPIPQLAKLCVDIVLRKKDDIVPTLSLLPVSYTYGGTTKEQA